MSYLRKVVAAGNSIDAAYLKALKKKLDIHKLQKEDVADLRTRLNLSKDQFSAFHDIYVYLYGDAYADRDVAKREKYPDTVWQSLVTKGLCSGENGWKTSDSKVPSLTSTGTLLARVLWRATLQ